MIVAVDPGSMGALAVFEDDGRLLEVIDMPMRRIAPPKGSKRKARNVVDVAQLRRLADCAHPDAWPLTGVVVEDAWSRPGEGTGEAQIRNHQAVVTLFEAFGHDVAGANPVKWKRAAEISSADDVTDRKRDQELQAMARASAIYPNHADRFQHVTRSGRAEAVLIGRWFMAELGLLLPEEVWA